MSKNRRDRQATEAARTRSFTLSPEKYFEFTTTAERLNGAITRLQLLQQDAQGLAQLMQTLHAKRTALIPAIGQTTDFSCDDKTLTVTLK